MKKPTGTLLTPLESMRMAALSAVSRDKAIEMIVERLRAKQRLKRLSSPTPAEWHK